LFGDDEFDGDDANCNHVREAGSIRGKRRRRSATPHAYRAMSTTWPASGGAARSVPPRTDASCSSCSRHAGAGPEWSRLATSRRRRSVGTAATAS